LEPSWKTNNLKVKSVEAYIDHTGTMDGLERILHEASARPGAGGIALFTCDDNGYEPRLIDPILSRVKLPIVGGLFPALFHGETLLEQGSIALSLPTPAQVAVLDGEHLDSAAIQKRLVASGLDSYPTMLVLVDGLEFHATTLLDALFDVYGPERKYLGGGAGSLTLERRPCLFTNDGFMGGGAAIMGIELPCGIGVAHGLMRVGGPYQITAAKGYEVQTIDWRPAADTFRELVLQHLEPGEDDTGGVVSRNFCLAINRLDAEYVVREVVKIGSGGTLLFPTQMHENELVDLVQADQKRMLAAAAKARQDAEADLGAKPKSNVCFDCCARKLYLGDAFSHEMRSLASGQAQVYGAITVGGEIANNGDSYLDYYNRTCVVGAF
jgi:hypothetical protein